MVKFLKSKHNSLMMKDEGAYNECIILWWKFDFQNIISVFFNDKTTASLKTGYVVNLRPPSYNDIRAKAIDKTNLTKFLNRHIVK